MNLRMLKLICMVVMIVLSSSAVAAAATVSTTTAPVLDAKITFASKDLFNYEYTNIVGEKGKLSAVEFYIRDLSDKNKLIVAIDYWNNLQIKDIATSIPLIAGHKYAVVIDGVLGRAIVFDSSITIDAKESGHYTFTKAVSVVPATIKVN